MLDQLVTTNIVSCLTFGV